MPIHAVLFRQAAATVRIAIESPDRFPAAPSEGGEPAAVVVRCSDLGIFREYGGEFRDRRHKHPAKSLSELLLGQGGAVPFLEAGYGSVGRLRQGIETLLQNAAAAGERKAYLLGVDEQVFDRLWNDASGGEELPVPAGESDSLPALLPEFPVPPELTRRFMGETKEYRFVRQLVLRAMACEDTVLIQGETGTGKSRIARAIHDLGRPGKPFKDLNCAAIPNDLLESELFGHERGAFTGADTLKTGLWEVAGNGTLFLDEVGDLALEHQGKVLKAIEDKRIRRVGGSQEIPVRARVIAATNRNLFAMTESGQFREDLFFRLREFVINAPPLRSDARNIERIAQACWKELHKAEPLPDDVIAELCALRWPGNVRELKALLGHLSSLFGHQEVRVEHVRAVIDYYKPVETGTPGTEDPVRLRVECLRHLRRTDESLHACERALAPLAEGDPLNDAARTAMARLQEELRTLLDRRLNFHTRETYDAVVRVERDLGHLVRLPAEDRRMLSSFCRNTLDPDLQRAIDRLFQETRQLMGQI